MYLRVLQFQCVRLTNEQFATFFPEFDEFQHQVLAVDTLHAASRDRGYFAFGCAEGYALVVLSALKYGQRRFSFLTDL